MTPIDVRVMVNEMRGLRDDETLHSMEDEIYRKVLKAIAAGADNAQALAVEALKTEEMEFAHWCA